MLIFALDNIIVVIVVLIIKRDQILNNSRSKIIPKIMLGYAFTFMMIELADSASMLIDGLIVSNFLGPTALAATGLGNTSFQMVSLFCSIFAIGIQSICSESMGIGDTKHTSGIFSGGMIIVCGVAVIITVLGFIFTGPLCLLIGADQSNPELYDGLFRFLRGWFVGIPGFIGFTVLSPIVALDGNKRLVTAATVVQSVINVSFDLLAVTVFNTGTWGVGFATGLGFDLAAIVLISNFFRKKTAFKFRFSLLSKNSFLRIFQIGLPRLTKYGCKMLAPLLINRTILAIGGSAAMAAMSVKSSIGNFCLVASNGIAESVNLLSQVFYSEKDKDALKTTAKYAIRANVVFGTILAVIVFFLAGPLAGLYLSKGTVESGMAETMLKLLALSIVLYGFNCAILNYLQGTRKMLPTHLQTASHRLVFLALLTFILGKTMGVTGLFAAIPLSEVCVLLTYIIIALATGKGKSRPDALLLLPKGFGYSEENSLAFSLNTMDEVIGISEKINEFCLSHGIDNRRAYYAALSMEELAGNIVDHGFRKDKKKHSVDVRVMIEDENVVLRIRDDCRYFNMKERYESMKDADPMKNVGIKLVYGIAKDIKYVNLLNTNTLIITI